MSLCSKCNALPFRRILKGDPELPTSRTNDALSEAYQVRLCDSISQLITSSQACKLCKVLAEAVTTSFWYEHMMKEEDRTRPVWLRMPVGSWSPVIWAYLGDDLPETKIFGKDVKIYLDSDDSLADTMVFRYVHENPTHDLALKQMDAWLEACNREHQQCSHVVRQQMRLPTRLLDLDALPRKESMIGKDGWHSLFHDKSLRLVENRSQEQGQYIALSYCWGSALAYKTLKENRASHMEGIGFMSLPKTLQDAIIITRYLGLRYIWIDCLCIVQDDKEDWQREAAQMAEIYSNSYLTIAAARATNCGEGFLGPRKIRSMQPVTFVDEDGSFQLYFYAYDVSPMPGSVESASLEPLKDEPLAKRAWTLQERLLPSRTLHFASDQMYWECAQKSQCEDGESFGSGDEDFRLDPIVQGLCASETGGRRAWYKLIEAYTSRNITYLSDKLPALSGVVAAIEQQGGDTCYAGVWKKHFLEELSWRLEDPDLDLYVSTPKPPVKLDVWRAPSWSFASVEGVIRYQELSDFGTGPCAYLESCSVVPLGQNPHGELESGYAQIRGPITMVEDVGQERAAEGQRCRLQLHNGSVDAKIRFDFELYEPCKVLMLTPHTGLAIKPLDWIEKKYVRVGTVQVWKDPGSSPLSDSQYPESTSITLL